MDLGNRGQTLKIFFADGLAEGLRIIEKSNWIGAALACSRSQFKSVKSRPEFDKPGVYILIGEDPENFQLKIYIGEGDPTRPRIEAHDRDSDQTKEFWEHLILFTSKDENLNKAHIQYLESRLVALAHEAKRCQLENGNNPKPPNLSESDKADMDNFLSNMVLVYGALGLSVFETPKSRKKDSSNALQFTLKSNGSDARGYDSVEGFIVLKGAKAVGKEVASIPTPIHLAREQMIKDRLLVQNGTVYELTQDYTFSSPSKAAAVFLGRSANGRVEWKDGNGRTMNEIEAQVEEDSSGKAN